MGPSSSTNQDRGQMVNSAKYCATLEEELKSAIRSKRRGRLTNGVAFHHDNERPHAAAVTSEIIRKLRFELPSYPA
jgi:hypothetical protein